mgnify:CR=1 FL=1
MTKPVHLLPAAMVGTDRQPLAATSPLPGPVGALLNDTLAQTPDSATALLRAAGIVATCSLAGGHGLHTGDAPPAAAAAASHLRSPDERCSASSAAAISTVSAR